MSEEAARGLCRAICDASVDGQPQRIAPFLHDDVEWTVFGPLDLFSFVGRRHGKQAALESCAQLARHLQVQHCENEWTIGDGSDAARMVRLTALPAETGRTMSLRMAHFAQFRDGKLARMVVVLDSLDAAEQVLGRHIDLNPGLSLSRIIGGGC